MKYETNIRPKKDKAKVYTLRADDFERQMQERYEKGVRDGAKTAIYTVNGFYTVAMHAVLHDKLGFGQKRLKRIHLAVQDLFSAIMDGYVSYEDLAQTLHDECRVNLVFEKADGAEDGECMEIFRREARRRERDKIGIRINGVVKGQ